MSGTVLALTLLLAGAPSGGGADPSAWQRAVGLLQYLSSDYPAAVRGGDAQELAEQRALAAEAERALAELGPAGLPFRARAADVLLRIERGVDPDGVARDSVALADDLARAGGLGRSPRTPPDLAQGAELFRQACSACHGTDGSGDRAVAAQLRPPAADLRSGDRMEAYSPFRAYNLLALGIEGTAMPSFPTLTEPERWALAFHLLTLKQPACDHAPPRASLEVLAGSTDAQLARRFGPAEVACLRRVMPRTDEDQALAATRAGIDRALGLLAGGNAAAARQVLIDTYLQAFEPAEPSMRARHPGLVQEFEAGMVRARLAAERGDPRFAAELGALRTLLEDAAPARPSAGEAATVFWLALLVVVREGFEVVIVIAALLAVLQRMGRSDQARVVHAGWVTALFAGALCFVFGRQLLAGGNRELMEGIGSLLASALLVYAALWLNARTHIRRYMGELRDRMEGALGRGSSLGLFAIAFTALFRESFETAIFLQGLSIDSGRGALSGAAAGLAVMVVLVLVIRRVGFVLPMKPLFTVSTWLLYATAVVLLGQGLHALQELGALPLLPVPGPRLDALGLFPDLLTLLPQLAMALAPLLLFLWRRGTGVGNAPLPRTLP